MEIWKDIEKFEGVYQVSNNGRLKSFKHGRERILKGGLNSKGYPHAILRLGSIAICAKLHRLVAIAFIENPENKPQVNHKNGIKTDNSVENLEWATNRENMDHAMLNGLRRKYPKGSEMTNAKLNENKVKGIREMHPEKSEHALARLMGVSRSVIHDVLSRRTWKHVA